MPQALPTPFMPTAGPVLEAMRLGEHDRLAREQRGALQQAGQLAAKGSLSEARKSLLGQGMFGEADQINQMMRQASADQLTKAKRTFDVLGNLARAADSPEKWQQAIQAAKAGGMDVSKYEDFGARDLILAQSGKMNEHLDYELKNRGLDLKQEALDRKYGGVGGIQGAGELSKGERWRMKGGQIELDASGRPIAEPIPGSSREAVSSETAARVGLADKFIDQAPALRKKIESGKMGGIDYYLNRGEAADIYRKIEDGSEALVRNLTGAGMNEEEARAYARRYLPTSTDTTETVLYKFDNLMQNLQAVKQRVLTGRGRASIDDAPQVQPQQAPPAAQPTPLPEMSDDDLLRELGIE